MKSSYNSMKTWLFLLLFSAISFSAATQTIARLPGVYGDLARYYPRCNEKVTFSTQYPLADFQNQKIDPVNTHQYLVSLPFVKDSILSVCIRYTMLRFTFEPAFKDISRGAEIWYGPVADGLKVDPAMIGIYYKSRADSITLYILTTYSLQMMEKKRKVNTSQSVGESIRKMVEKVLQNQ